MTVFTDCKDDGCGECDICIYLNFLEWAESVGGNSAGNSIQRNPEIEKYLDRHYPHWR